MNGVRFEKDDCVHLLYGSIAQQRWSVWRSVWPPPLTVSVCAECSHTALLRSRTPSPSRSSLCSQTLKTTHFINGKISLDGVRLLMWFTLIQTDDMWMHKRGADLDFSLDVSSIQVIPQSLLSNGFNSHLKHTNRHIINKHTTEPNTYTCLLVYESMINEFTQNKHMENAINSDLNKPFLTCSLFNFL